MGFRVSLVFDISEYTLFRAITDESEALLIGSEDARRPALTGRGSKKVKRTVSGACTDDDLEAATAVINLISVY